MDRLTQTYLQTEDETLMQWLVKGDEKAFGELYRRYSQRMLDYFYRMLGRDEEKAQDFLQDLFLKLVEKPHLYDSKRRFSTWLYAVAANMCKNEYRSREVRRIMETVPDFGPEAPREKPDDERFDREQFETGLMSELENLSFEHRSVFLLRYQEERSVKEIAHILGCTEGTVKSRTFYALRKLAARLHLFNPKL